MPGYDDFFDDIQIPSAAPEPLPSVPSGQSSAYVPAAPGSPPAEADGPEQAQDEPSRPEDSGVLSLERQADMEAFARGRTPTEMLAELQYRPQQTAVGAGSGSGPVSMPGARVLSDKMVRVEIHKELYDVIKTFVVGASNKTDTLEAFICAWAGDYVPVPDNVRELIDKVKVPVDELEQTTNKLFESVVAMQKNLRSQDRSIDVMRLCVMWLVAEKMGFTVSFTGNVNKADFIFPDYDQMLKQLSSQISQHQEAQRRRVGRRVGEQAMRNRNGGK